MFFSGSRITQEDKMLPVWKKIRPTMRFLFGTNLGHKHGRASLCGYTIDSFESAKENHAITIPRSASVLLYVAQHLWSPTRCLDFRELPINKVGNEPPIWRPER